MDKLVILTVALFGSLCPFAQKEIIFGQAVERVYRTTDSSQNFYFVMEPGNRIERIAPRALLVLEAFPVNF